MCNHFYIWAIWTYAEKLLPTVHTILQPFNTPGNPFAHPRIKRLSYGKYNTHLVMFTDFFGRKCPFGWILLIGMYQRAFLIGYRHVSVRFCVCETLRCASYLLLERVNWLLQRPPSTIADELPRINPARSCFNIWDQGSISVKNTHFRGNQVICLQSAEGGRCNNPSTRSSKR